MQKKRPREEAEESWWERAVAWITNEGGQIHPLIGISAKRELYAKENIEAGEQILCIPQSCLVSMSTVETTTFGKKIKQVIDKIDGSKKFYSPVQDISIALFLAAIEDDKSSFVPYLDTLPDKSTYNALPRRWTDKQLELLKGTSVLPRIQQQQAGIQADYQLVLNAWKDFGWDEKDLPSFESLSDALATVSSRAFAGFGDNSRDDSDIALVPLLDLCDHCRGNKNATKNISYKKSSTDESVIVMASQPIGIKETLRITYGAQGNSQLLLNYGFCIPDNIEPDGSTNDFIDFYPVPNKSDCPLFHLKAGPKAHSFHGFVNALDYFRLEANKGIGGNGASPSADNADYANDFDNNEHAFAAFDVDITMNINEMSEEDSYEGSKDFQENREEETARKIENYHHALCAFRVRLADCCRAYSLSGEALKDAVTSLPSSSMKYHVALLIRSEQRTHYFFLNIIDQIEELLGKHNNNGADLTLQECLQISNSDRERLHRQAEALSVAFVKLRIPELLSQQDLPRG